MSDFNVIKDKVKIEDLEKDPIFNLKNGKAVLLEMDKNIALLKKIGVKDYPYVVASGLSVSKYETYFEWNQGSYFQTLSEANESFEELKEHEKIINNLKYSELGEFTLGRFNIARFDNVNEIFSFFLDRETIRKDIIEMLPEKAKRDVVYKCADVLVEEDGKFYYGEDFCFFEDEINDMTLKIDKILNELNISNVKPYDVIELLEQDEANYIDTKLEKNISKAIKEAGYDKNIKTFINYINENLYNYDEIKEDEEEHEGGL